MLQRIGQSAVALPLIAICLCILVTTTAGAQSGYRFPISADRELVTWEEPHWDGSNAVDIGLHSGFGLDAPERRAFYESDAVAVITGRASRLDNPRGGVAVLLHGVDGRTYYYAHLSTTPITEPTTVVAGDSLGRIGRSGVWSRYLEPHLHFAVAEGHQHGTDWTADVAAPRWLERTFGGVSLRSRAQPHAADLPSGLPLFGTPMVVDTFEQLRTGNPYLAGVTLSGPSSRSPGTSIPIRAPMTGIARVHLDTPLGVRVQITNGRSSHSLIISGSIDPLVRTGDLVFGDSVVGFVTGPLH